MEFHFSIREHSALLAWYHNIATLNKPKDRLFWNRLKCLSFFVSTV